MIAERFAAVWVALYVAHMVGDYWVQTDHQALTKGQSGWPGRRACAGHVATYTATALVALLAVAWRLDLDLSAARVAAGLAVSAGTHYVADRRAPLRVLVAAMDRSGLWSGKLAYHDDHGGAAHLDQAIHIAMLLIAALIIA